MGDKYNYFYALDLDSGAEVFRYAVPNNIDAIRVVVAENDIVYFIALSGRIYAYVFSK